jgi:hypothetical protein
MTIATGKVKYANKAQIAAAKWNAAKGQMAANWAAGLAEAGAAPGPLMSQAYQAGLATAQYRMGSADKWERNFRAAMSR